jgi:hypothetical protein
MTNATVAAGMITGREPGSVRTPAPVNLPSAGERVTRAEQESRAGHPAVTIWLDAFPELAHQVERLLFDANCRVLALPGTGPAVAETCRTLNDAGVIALVYAMKDVKLRQHIRRTVGAGTFLNIKTKNGTAISEEIAARIFRAIEERRQVV